MTVPAGEPPRQRLADWFHQWRTPLRRYLVARARLSSADADDLAQEVFLRMLRYERAELVTHPQAYLFRIAANVLAEWSTRASRRQPHASDWLAQLVDERDPQYECASEDESLELARAIGSLPPRAREILRLHYQEGLTHEVIAQRLNTTRRIVKRDLIRAYAELRGLLGAQAVQAPSRRSER
jgi:RNA polymerase sigma factor (sigma-70 family)